MTSRDASAVHDTCEKEKEREKEREKNSLSMHLREARTCCPCFSFLLPLTFFPLSRRSNLKTPSRPLLHPRREGSIICTSPSSGDIARLDRFFPLFVPHLNDQHNASGLCKPSLQSVKEAVVPVLGVYASPWVEVEIDLVLAKGGSADSCELGQFIPLCQSDGCHNNNNHRAQKRLCLD